MKTLRHGATGPAVKGLQRILNNVSCADLEVDGVFGDVTEEAVESFQKLEDLLVDGIVGRGTWNRVVEKLAAGVEQLSIVRVDVDEYEPGNGYKFFNLREDVAGQFRLVVDEVHSKGGVITSSGSLRPLFMNVSANRSATSLHYAGIALDLNIWSGMVDPHTDPYVCVRSVSDPRSFRVYARVEEGPILELDAYTYDTPKNGGKTVKVEGKFIDLTALMERYGFKPIRARKSFFRGNNKLGAEWWHFQYEAGFNDKEEIHFFGVELAKIDRLEPQSPPYEYRSRAFGYDWF